MSDFKNTIYYGVGKASELSGMDRWIYRALEIMPGFLTWITFIFVIIGSMYVPMWTAIFIICFDIYWLLKTIYLSIYLHQNWKKTRHNMQADWIERLKNIRYEHLHHIILLPFYNEEEFVVLKTLEAIKNSVYDKKRISVVLGAEVQAGESAREIAERMQSKYADVFHSFLITYHPSGVEGEMAGKGSNISYSAKEAKEKIIDKYNLNIEDVIVSAFDIDTVVYPQYFNCLSWTFLTTEDPHRSSFQPIPLYNNNLLETPAFSRVPGVLGTFWQMIQQERMDKLVTFSSHSMSFKALIDIKYWQSNIVSEDSRIFWNAYLAYDGDYKVVPMCYPVSMDANLASTMYETAKNVYKQQRRWAWGAENIPYVLFGFIKNKYISAWDKFRFTYFLVEGGWFRTTSSILILLLGWLPIWLGGREFSSTLMSYNLPLLTRDIMTLTMLGLILSARVALSFLPEDEGPVTLKTKIYHVLQWLLVPFTSIIFGNIPAIEAQTRLMFGKYMGFWVTPKHRKNK